MQVNEGQKVFDWSLIDFQKCLNLPVIPMDLERICFATSKSSNIMFNFFPLVFSKGSKIEHREG